MADTSATTTEAVSLRQVENLALKLSANGPDEFPFGYYVYLAKIRLGFEEELNANRSTT